MIAIRFSKHLSLLKMVLKLMQCVLIWIARLPRQTFRLCPDCKTMCLTGVTADARAAISANFQPYDEAIQLTDQPVAPKDTASVRGSLK